MQTKYNKPLINFMMRKNKIINKKVFLAFLFSIFFFSFLLFINIDNSSAASLVPGSTQMNDSYKKGDYELNDVLRVGVQITKLILGIVGSLALLFFVYGGLMFLISAGSSDKVQQAKTIIVNASIGLIIVFTSYIIIEFAMKALGVNWTGTSAVISFISVYRFI